MRKVLVIAAILFLLLLLAFPGAGMQAAKCSLNLWIENVVPALLPFFMLSGILLKTGFLQSLGRAFAPLMKPLRLNGAAAPVFLIGMVSGYPSGAKLAGELQKEGLLDADSTGRLAGIANLCGPMTLLGTVATGLLGAPGLGWRLVVAHYAGAVLTAALLSIAWPLKGAKVPAAGRASSVRAKPVFSPVAAVTDAINDSMLAMLRIGGSIMFFTVAGALLEATGALRLIADAFSFVLGPLGVPRAAVYPMLEGTFEMIGGVAAVAKTTLSLGAKSVCASILLAFGGGAILFQTFSFAKIKALPYIGARTVHAVFAALITFFLTRTALPVSAAVAPGWKVNLGISLALAAGTFLGLCAASLICMSFKRRSRVNP